VVRDEIVIVQPSSRHVVAVVPVGGGRTGSNAPRGGGSAVAVSADSMSVEEIRSLQVALRDKGFTVEVDGKFGPSTRQALVQFQRREGFQANGQIDVRTRTALGLSAQGGSSTTTGQGGNQPSGNMQNNHGNQPSMNNQNNQNNQNQPATGGNNQPQQPRANNSSDHQNQPATTGQGGNNNQDGNAQQQPSNQNMPANQNGGPSLRGNSPNQNQQGK
jgi:peptidoglycan hydrolase-like protein with peptidoglycan-binding domain